MKIDDLIYKLQSLRRCSTDGNVDVIITGAYGLWTDFISSPELKKFEPGDVYEVCVIKTDIMSG